MSAATSENAYQLGALADRLWILDKGNWSRDFRAALRRDALVDLARRWPSDLDLYGFTKLCEGLVWGDDSIALDMVEGALPQIRKRIADDPGGGFWEVDDIASRVLRILDVLGVYKGRLAPGDRHWALGRAMVADLDPKRLAVQLSGGRMKSFQATSYLLEFLRLTDPEKFKATIADIEWDKVADTIGEHWSRLPHDAEVLLGVAFGAPKSRARIKRLVLENLNRIEVLPARLAYMSPDAAERMLDEGKRVATASYDHVHWLYTSHLITKFAARRPDLLDTLLAPIEAVAAKAFSQRDSSWYAEAGPTLAALSQHAPQVLARILDGIDPKSAEVGWRTALRKGRGAARTVDQLIAAATERLDATGAVARQLRAEFSKAT